MKARIEKILTYEATKSIWRKDFKSIEFNECSELNRELFGIPLNRAVNCQCIEDFFLLLKIKLKNNKIFNIMEKKFVVKGVIMHHALSDALTKDSSDEDVIAFLSKVDAPEKHLKSFERFPSDWEELISKKSKAKKEVAPKVEKTEKTEKAKKEVALKVEEEEKQIEENEGTQE